MLRGRARKTFPYNAAGRQQISLIVGNVLQGTKLSLSVWFLAIHQISQVKTGLSALARKRPPGLSYPTA